MKKMKLAALGLTVFLAGSVFCMPVMADDADDAQANLDAVNASIAEYEQQKNDLLNQIDDLEAQLVTTISSVKHINEQLDEVSAKLSKTEEKLSAAEKDAEVQKNAMKARIQYYYENGGTPGWAAALVEDGDIQAALSADMEKDMYDYDRQQLEDYSAAVDKVNELKSEQLQQRSELNDKKNALTESQNQLQSLLDQAKDKYSAEDYDAKIADAYAKADEYTQIIANYNNAISESVEATAVDTTTSEAQTAINTAVQQLVARTGVSESQAKAAATAAYKAQASSSSSSGTIGNGSTASGAALVSYAEQFLGNPYVWGGTSLTNGADCSGFVQSVYKNFGINVSHSSYAIANEGTEVSYQDAQAGDVFVYDGHVGIYVGNGQMINAVNEQTGIAYTNVNYDNIQTIRRFLPSDTATTSATSSAATSSAATSSAGTAAASASADTTASSSAQ
ncbi:MAG: NlpC/P60 family protein [Eubacteriales bacterium]|jgi:cell wall-associated NlpC family hydrolase